MPLLTIGGYVHNIGFYLNDNRQHFISESDITETWGTGAIEPYHYFFKSISFQIPEDKEEVVRWEARWFCLDADEQ